MNDTGLLAAAVAFGIGISPKITVFKPRRRIAGVWSTMSSTPD